MSKLSELLSCDVYNEEDVRLLKSAIPEINFLPDSFVESAYRDFSHERYSAGWMRLDEDLVDSFKYWLLS